MNKVKNNVQTRTIYTDIIFRKEIHNKTKLIAETEPLFNNLMAEPKNSNEIFVEKSHDKYKDYFNNKYDEYDDDKYANESYEEDTKYLIYEMCEQLY